MAWGGIIRKSNYLTVLCALEWSKTFGCLVLRHCWLCPLMVNGHFALTICVHRLYNTTYIYDGDIDIPQFLWLHIVIRAVESKPCSQLTALQSV